MSTNKIKATSRSAVTMSFDAISPTEPASPLCGAIRIDVDLILGKSSDYAIKQTTPNEDLLSHYLFDSVTANLYLALNKVLAKYPSFTRIKSDAIKGSTSVGDVRALAYAKCSVTCTPT